ncbi:hypothetical protein I4F81_002551 [Pyropia yezoensis]|uniref:Uncharacterized protein n=1 Tax=Pyropia yezoensis TaxID=2788 RepID=A0ACC3BQN9_PYRYE|nr:hypothetical protein I4F81_002551 [Neopyropia yezoensis]
MTTPPVRPWDTVVVHLAGSSSEKARAATVATAARSSPAGSIRSEAGPPTATDPLTWEAVMRAALAVMSA